MHFALSIHSQGNLDLKKWTKTHWSESSHWKKFIFLEIRKKLTQEIEQSWYLLWTKIIIHQQFTSDKSQNQVIIRDTTINRTYLIKFLWMAIKLMDWAIPAHSLHHRIKHIPMCWACYNCLWPATPLLRCVQVCGNWKTCHWPVQSHWLTTKVNVS